MSKHIESEFNVGSNEDVADTSLMTLHDYKIEDSYK